MWIYPLPDCSHQRISGPMSCIIVLRGGVKKKYWFFLLLVKKLRPPPPPFLTTSVFSDKDFLDWPRPPPLFGEIVKKIPVFSDKDFLDWPRPPPLFAEIVKKIPVFFIKPPFFGKLCQKISVFLIKPFWIGWDPPPWSKKSEYFLIRIFWIGRDPPAPLLTKSKKKPVFFFDGSPNWNRLQQKIHHHDCKYLYVYNCRLRRPVKRRYKICKDQI